LRSLNATVKMPKKIAASPESEHHFFKRGVSSTLANAIDSALYLARTGPDRGEGIGDSQAEIVVAMDAKDGFAGTELWNRAMKALETYPENKNPLPRLAAGNGKTGRYVKTTRLPRSSERLAAEYSIDRA